VVMQGLIRNLNRALCQGFHLLSIRILVWLPFNQCLQIAYSPSSFLWQLELQMHFRSTSILQEVSMVANEEVPIKPKNQSL